jgi:hypothetical protein
VGWFHSSLAADVPSDKVRAELLTAREVAWRSFVQKDPAVVEGILAPELIAIQENSDRWENRERLVELAKSMGERGVQMTRLEFPRTEIQLFGDTAILYYTYIMEQKLGANTAVSAGRGTEVFVRRKGRWVDVGWHLDSGAFQQKDGSWIRVADCKPPHNRVARALLALLGRQRLLYRSLWFSVLLTIVQAASSGTARPIKTPHPAFEVRICPTAATHRRWCTTGPCYPRECAVPAASRDRRPGIPLEAQPAVRTRIHPEPETHNDCRSMSDMQEQPGESELRTHSQVPGPAGT